jgi:hypothetical protein
MSRKKQKKIVYELDNFIEFRLKQLMKEVGDKFQDMYIDLGKYIKKCIIMNRNDPYDYSDIEEVTIEKEIPELWKKIKDSRHYNLHPREWKQYGKYIKFISNMIKGEKIVIIERVSPPATNAHGIAIILTNYGRILYIQYQTHSKGTISMRLSEYNFWIPKNHIRNVVENLPKYMHVDSYYQKFTSIIAKIKKNIIDEKCFGKE